MSIDNTKECILCYTSYNRLSYTKKTLPLLVENTSDKTQIIVWDNGSNNETIQWLSKFSKNNDITIYYNDKNVGTAIALNKVMRIMDEKHYFIKFDNDVCIEEKDWDVKLIEYCKKYPNIGLIAPKVNPNLASKDNEYALHVSSDIIADDGNTLELVQEIIGHVIMITPQVRKQIGYFYTGFAKWGYEDCDYARRIFLSNYDQVYIPHIKCSLLYNEELDCRKEKDKLQLMYSKEFWERYEGYYDDKYSLFVDYEEIDNEEGNITYL